VSLHPPIRDFKLCYVTDRKSLSGSQDEQRRLLLAKIERAASAGVDWIQIREKDLSGKELCELAREAIRRVLGSCRILVNDRLDVALAAGAGGVHLGEKSISVPEAKRLLRERDLGGDFLVGASVHSLDAAMTAKSAGADYVIFGPVFETPSKAKFGQAQGTDILAAICRRVSIPVIAIGGITLENAAQCLKAGAGGIAAIRMFQDADDVDAIVQDLREG
jgi:thiamine-phosphate pyrophosphorylase